MQAERLSAEGLPQATQEDERSRPGERSDESAAGRSRSATDKATGKEGEERRGEEIWEEAQGKEELCNVGEMAHLNRGMLANGWLRDHSGGTLSSG